MIGSTVIRIRDGQQGTIVSMDDREVVVRFAATGETRNSPFGEYADAGEVHHCFRAYFARFYKVYEVVAPPANAVADDRGGWVVGNHGSAS